MNNLEQTSLILFFTRGVSLKTWADIGLLDREVSLYKSLRPSLGAIRFVTYGDARDRSAAYGVDGIHVTCNRWGLPGRWYSSLLTRLYPLVWRGPAIVKSNQVDGAEIALQVSQRFGMKFIARCGYLPSNIAIWRYGKDSPESKEARQLESTVFHGADRVVVTTTSMFESLTKRYGVNADTIRIIPNYVDIQRFKPVTKSREPNHLCYVGRLEKGKNVHGLLNAISGLDVKLTVIGGGNLQKELMAQAREKRLNADFPGNVPHQKLPDYLNQASLFIQPSFIEHHPKSLLEAMACGLPVIGTNVPGIREIIHHRETGYLCATSPEAMREAIRDVLSDGKLCDHMGKNARRYVTEECALESIVNMELALLRELAG